MDRFFASMALAALALAGTGCELIVDFDRSLIDSGMGGGTDTGPMPDVFTPDTGGEDGGPDGGMGDGGGGDGGCEGEPAAFCDDMNDCTTDACDTGTGMCTHADVAGCCNNSDDCDDTDACTADVCDMDAHTCSNERMTDCCTAGGPVDQCEDGSDCTDDSCDVPSMTCDHDPIAGCCTLPADCVDLNPCTVDTCDVGTGTCMNVMTPGCCAVAADCDDENTCTTDTCGITMMCMNAPITDCCTMASMCDDSDICTTNTCNTTINECEFPAIADCCENDLDCPDDGNVCTIESCNMGTNRCQRMDAATTEMCNDGLFCTMGETCDGSGACGGGTMRSCADSDACTVDFCDEAGDMCRNASTHDSVLAVLVDDPGDDGVRLRNPSATVPLDVSGFFVCRSDVATPAVACFDIPAGTTIAGGATLAVRGGTGTDTMTEIFTGGDLGLDVADGEVAVATTGTGTEVCDYVQWGAGMHTMAADAVTEMEWSAAGDFVDATGFMNGESLRWDPTSGDNDDPTDWSVSMTF